MDGMHWIADTMAAAQTRLEMATTNLANAHVAGYQPRQFSAQINENGINCTSLLPQTGSITAGRGVVPSINSASEMVSVLEAQRHFETAQKVALSFDALRSKEASDVGRAGS